jgi:hypothetical protein
MSRQCGILNISQPSRPPRPVTGIALLYLLFYERLTGTQEHSAFLKIMFIGNNLMISSGIETVTFRLAE